MAERLKLVRKHPLALRWFHWINFPAIFIMGWSGILIYWASRTDRITFFGKQALPQWVLDPPAPSWWPKWLPHDSSTVGDHTYRSLWSMDFRLAEGMGWHFTFMWLFVLNGCFYLLFLAFSGQWRVLAPGKRSLQRAIGVVLHDLHIVKKPPEQDQYNEAQKLAYIGVIVMGIIMVLTGFGLYKPTQTEWLCDLFGGYQMTRWFHFWTTMLLFLFFLVHVSQVVKSGWNNFRSMITGYALEKQPETELQTNVEPS